jgi:hypothetical protein
MIDIIVEIMVEVLVILAIATREIKENRSSESIDIHHLFLAYCSLEKFAKLLGKSDVEDALKRLDTLTQEEARMATAEVLKVTFKVGKNMTALIDGAKLTFSTHPRFPDTDRPGGKEAKASNVNKEKCSSSDLNEIGSRRLITAVGNQIQEKLYTQLSPPDPSTDHNIARKVHHEGTSTWFFQGGMYQEWKSSPSLLWIHGKRTSLWLLILHSNRLICIFVAGSGKSVLWYVFSRRFCLHQLKLSQFWDNRGYNGATRGGIGDHGLFLLRFS